MRLEQSSDFKACQVIFNNAYGWSFTRFLIPAKAGIQLLTFRLSRLRQRKLPSECRIPAGAGRTNWVQERGMRLHHLR